MPSSRLPQRRLSPDTEPELGPSSPPGPGSGSGPGSGPGSGRQPGRPDLVDVLTTLACFLGAGFAAGALADLFGLSAATPQARALLVPLVLAGQSLIFLAAFLVLVRRGRALSLRSLGLGPFPPQWLQRGALWGLGVVIPAMAINAVTLSLLGGAPANPQVDVLAPAGPSLVSFLAVLPLASILVPFVEELAFRGVLYGWLRRHLPAGWAMTVSAGLFSVAHGIPQLIPALLLVGFYLARLRERSDSLWPAIAMHGAFNAVMTAVLFLALGQMPS